MIDIKKVKEEAEKEFREEKFKTAKAKVKSKLEELHKAKLVVSNIERDLGDLYDEIGQNS